MSNFPVGRTLLSLLVITGMALWWNGRPVTYPPGVVIPGDPVQEDAPAQSLGEYHGFALTGVAHYVIRGRVLGMKRYHSGPAADLVPVDVALGWNRMSDQRVLDRLTLSMSNRFFFYQWSDQPPLPEAEIRRSASNNHVIAANDGVTRALGSLRIGHVIEMRGWLVDAVGPGGAPWRTSRRRDDTGNGACELFFVEQLSVANPEASPWSALHL